jgi:4-aminobutyrate aminotransferase-like enzyme
MVALTQVQNEAIVKLMLLARYQDKKLSLTEEAQFNQYLNELHWQSVTAVDTYAMRETTVVRKALDSAEATQAFIAQQNQVLNSPEAKQAVLTMVERLLSSDGVADAESQFLQQLKASLNA